LNHPDSWFSKAGYFNHLNELAPLKMEPPGSPPGPKLIITMLISLSIVTFLMDGLAYFFFISRGVPRHAPRSADGLIDYDTMRIRSFFGFNTDEIDTCCRIHI
jgi:hypothetical protein